MAVQFTTAPIDNQNNNIILVEIRIRNTDPSNQMQVVAKLFDEGSSTESLVSSTAFVVNSSSTESVSLITATLTSFLIEIEVVLENRSDDITVTAAHPTITIFGNSIEFIQFIRTLVSNPNILQEIEYPITPQLNLFLPDKIDCGGTISGDLTLGGVPQPGIDVMLSASVTGVSFTPNPSVTDMNGDFVTTVTVPKPTFLQNSLFSASTQFNGNNIQTQSITEVECGVLLYVTGGGEVSVVDGNSRMIIDTVSIEEVSVQDIGVSRSTAQLYVPYSSGSSTTGISVIDLLTNTLNTSVTFPSGQRFGIDVNKLLNNVYVSQSSGVNAIEVIDPQLNQIIDTITISNGGNVPFGVAVNDITQSVYVAADNVIILIDANTNNITDTIGTAGNYLGIAVSQNLNKIYAKEFSNNIAVIDGAINEIVMTITVGAPGTGATSPLAVSENTDQLYVSNGGDDTVSIVDVTNDIIIKTLSVGNSPAGIAVSETLDQVFVVNYQENTVSVIDAITNNIIDTITGFMTAGNAGVIAISESC
ncbi:YncE family protein [Bacillus carboniphilus]|uniref:YncE family protein n=1 Tax=Bacillus carboniphilus TaxID=86663 RepID=A0ABY9JSV3_9BACI|nr:YncE family protein [Bacillus carboniphilus]WLR42474.1 YncE family protein [Bacillus carboniphilus]